VEGIFQTRVYGFGGLQTRVPGFDVCKFDNRPISPASVVTIADSQSWTINSYVQAVS